MKNKLTGFTLIELLVTISIIGILSSIIYANFEDAKQQSRDKVRMTALKELQASLALYKAQYGSYPTAGCGVTNSQWAGPGTGSSGSYIDCANYIEGLVPDFIPELPKDPNSENAGNMGFFYRSDGNSYKAMILGAVETLEVDSYNHEFARCPKTGGACSGATPPANTYAVYSYGAEDW